MRPIWMYWHSGYALAPELIKACISTVVRNSECDVRLVDFRSAAAVLPGYDPRTIARLTPSHQADILRIELLYRYGGMYMDCDTIVVSSLKRLFDLVPSYELVGADWSPRGRPDEAAPICEGVIGPMKPGLTFLGRVIACQQTLLVQRERQLDVHGWTSTGQVDARYPFGLEELLTGIVSASYRETPPRAYLVNGAQSWCAYVGGPEWNGGDGRHLYRPLDTNEELVKSDLYAFSYSLAPAFLRTSSLSQILANCPDWILAKLLTLAGATAGAAGRMRSELPAGAEQ